MEWAQSRRCLHIAILFCSAFRSKQIRNWCSLMTRNCRSKTMLWPKITTWTKSCNYKTPSSPSNSNTDTRPSKSQPLKSKTNHYSPQCKTKSCQKWRNYIWLWWRGEEGLKRRRRGWIGWEVMAFCSCRVIWLPLEKRPTPRPRLQSEPLKPTSHFKNTASRPS